MELEKKLYRKTEYANCSKESRHYQAPERYLKELILCELRDENYPKLL